MKFSRVSLAVCAIVIMLFSGCKKDDPIDDTLIIYGRVRLPLPQYVEPGFTKSFLADTLSTLYREDGGAIGYYFSDPFTNKRDTVRREDETVTRVHTISVQDTLGVKSVTFSGYAKGYYGNSVSTTFTVVRQGLNRSASITSFDVAGTDKTFTDPRDGKTYYTTEVDGTVWMRQNLAWKGAGVPYAQCDVVNDIFGRFYTWTEAQNACPEGWRLPSENDWVALGAKFAKSAKGPYMDIEGVSGHLMENLKFNGERMWTFERYVDIDNKARFSAMPSGYAEYDPDTAAYSFKGMNAYAFFWTSESDGGCGGARYIYKTSDDMMYGLFDKDGIAASVRCVK